MLLGLVACAESPDSEATGAAEPPVSVTPVVEPVEEAPPIPLPADGFDFPVGPPDARKYYNAQPFGENDHLGDDWNGTGGGDSDLGDPVHSIAGGIVTVAEDFEAGWGNVVRVQHNIGTADAPELIESLYAHLDSFYVAVGDTLERGELLGTIGNAHGAYWAHLHFEIRDTVDLPLGGGYSPVTTGYMDPTAFIRSHRPSR